MWNYKFREIWWPINLLLLLLFEEEEEEEKDATPTRYKVIQCSSVGEIHETINNKISEIHRYYKARVKIFKHI